MTRLTHTRSLIAAILAAVILGTVVTVPERATADGFWTEFQCWQTVAVGVTGGTLTGRACESFYTTTLDWAVWGDTTAPYSSDISTYVAAYARCGGDPFQYRMSSWNVDGSTGYGTSGNPGYGTYPDCSNGHGYQDYGSHWRNSLSEGGSGYDLAH